MSNSVVRPVRIFRADALTVQVYESSADVALAASAWASDILQSAIEARGEAAAIFATGRSQKQFLSHLTAPDNPKAIDWARVTGFHLDEYLGLPATHPASFRAYMAEHLTSRVPIGEFYALDGDGLLPMEICQAYEAKLRHRILDLCCLGVGNNGHLAFNDPAVARFDDSHWVNIVRLDEENRKQQAGSTAFHDLQSVPCYALTLTLSAICAAQNLLCLAFGTHKADIVHRLLTGLVQPRCPASILRKTPHARLMLDLAAAQLLQD